VKRFIAVVVTASMLGATPVAFAGDHGRGGHGWRGGGGHGYSPHYRYSGYRHHKNNDNDDDAWAWALGGLLVGGLVTHGIHQARAASAVSTSVYQAPYPAPAPATGRRLLRDLEGRCYEILSDAAGNELRSELPPRACSW
jgi:hypothetical protein